MIDDTKFVRDGPAFENHHTLNDPMGTYWMKKLEWTSSRGGAAMQTSPCEGVQNSHPMLSIIAQPRQGSWRVDTWRK